MFTILFLDFGLSVAQFSILNAVWAATIVLAEVPSGALADIIGRKRLLVFATMTMIVEIGIISFVPKTNPSVIFMVFLLNRVLSGLAEAAASGADEAIAYDSLPEINKADQWGKVLEILMRFQSVGFIIAMSVGAAIYDPHLVQGICRFFGIEIALTLETTMRFPLYLTLLLALGAFVTTLRMKDPQTSSLSTDLDKKPVLQAVKLTFKAGVWILETPFALSVILFGMLFDGIIRMVITLSSQYYRMIELPESVFGIIGSLIALLGFVIPKIARKIVQTHSPAFSVWLTSFLTITGLVTMSFFWPYAGLIPAVITFSAMYFTGFFVSFYINQVTSSDQRATVLSFKGLAYNISYGILGVLYALLLKINMQGTASQDNENLVFMDTFSGFPIAFALWFSLLLLIYYLWLKHKTSFPKNE